jgi:hypothetical protein
MKHQEIFELVQELVINTKSKKFYWKPTSRPDEFMLSLDRGTILIANWPDLGSRDINIFDASGNLAFFEETNPENPLFEKLEELHQAAEGSQENTGIIGSLLEEIKAPAKTHVAPSFSS